MRLAALDLTEIGPHSLEEVLGRLKTARGSLPRLTLGQNAPVLCI